MSRDCDVIIIGAGAAGLMCAIEAGKRGRKVWLIDHSKKTAEKIRISGGGRCNFTNIHASPDHFLSQNPHFCKSALSRYTPQDFIALVTRHNIKFHEKKLGQLFCDDSSQHIIDMLLAECADAGVVISMDTSVSNVEKSFDGYVLQTTQGEALCSSLVIATGGLSIPKIGATGFGYDIARQFGLNVITTLAGLVPLTFTDDILSLCRELTGLSVEASVAFEKVRFAEGLLFTHRGLSGPSILQISSYWQEGQSLAINLTAGVEAAAILKTKKSTQPRLEVHNALAEILPKRLAQMICEQVETSGRLGDLPDKTLDTLGFAVNQWQVRPAGTEGYRTAEVTLGGVDTAGLSSKTMESLDNKGLYFIGEVVDVTGHLGGFNFQWAWASGYAAGHYV